MRHIIYATTLAVFLGAACTPTPPLVSDVGIIDSVPRRSLANSPVQQEATAALLEGMREMNASAGAVVILDVNTGRVLSLVSVVGEDAADSGDPQFNRAANNVHELGRAMAIFPIAQALDEGLIADTSMIATPPYLSLAGFRIRDFRPRGSEMTPAEVFVNASIVGIAQISQEIGAERQQAFLGSLGFLDSNPIEERYPTSAEALRPSRWGKLSTATVSYGHGLSVSPLQLAVGYASIVNGGTRVYPTLGLLPKRGGRIVSQETSAYVRELLRETVVTGTASLADVPGYSVGGATGTSDVRLPNGRFAVDETVTTFAAVFPIEEPRYVVVALLEDPVYSTNGEDRRTAGWTVVPVTGNIIERVGPLLFKGDLVGSE